MTTTDRPGPIYTESWIDPLIMPIVYVAFGVLVLIAVAATAVALKQLWIAWRRP